MCFQLEQLQHNPMMCAFQCGHLSPYGLDEMIPHLKDAHGLNFQRIERDYVCGLCRLRNTYEIMFEHMQNMHSDDLASTPINKLVSVVLQERPENPWKKQKSPECFIKMERVNLEEYENVDQVECEKVDQAECENVDQAECEKLTRKSAS